MAKNGSKEEVLRPYMLVVHRKGYVRTQLSRYKYVNRAISNGFSRLLRGGDWFQVVQMEPAEVELATGTREGVTASVSWSQRASKFVREEAPLNWPNYLKRAKRMKGVEHEAD